MKLFYLTFFTNSIHLCTYCIGDLIFTLPIHRFGSVFLWDSGSSVGNIDGHSKAVNAVDYKPTRPFRICTASEDREIGFFEGPPFKSHHFNRVGSQSIGYCAKVMQTKFVEVCPLFLQICHEKV